MDVAEQPGKNRTILIAEDEHLMLRLLEKFFTPHGYRVLSASHGEQAVDLAPDRLRQRRTDSPEVIARRLRDAVADMSHWNEFQYVIVNDNFDQALTELRSIVAGRGDALSSSRPTLAPVVTNLLAD